jgi:hypothetical protein
MFRRKVRGKVSRYKIQPTLFINCSISLSIFVGIFVRNHPVPIVPGSGGACNAALNGSEDCCAGAQLCQVAKLTCIW